MAFNEDTSFIEYNVEQPTQDFVTNFDTIGGTTDVVLVTVDGVLTDTPESSYTVQQINHTTWRVTPEVPAGSVVRLYRVTDIDEMMHVFTAGAKFIARNMDNNFKQIRQAQQEVRDNFSKLKDDIGFTNLEETVAAVTSVYNETVDVKESVDLVSSNVAGMLTDATNQANLAQGYASSANSANAAAQQAVIDVSTAEADVYSALSAQQISVNNSLTAIAGGHKAYQTLALAQADQASLPVNTVVEVTNDGANNGTYQWNGTALTKSAYDPLTQAKADATTKANAAEANAKDYFKTNGTGVLIPANSAVINYDKATKVLSFTGTFYVVTNDTTVTSLTTPQSLTLTSGNPYRIECDSAGTLFAVSYSASKTIGRIVLGWIRTPAETRSFEVSGFKVSVNGVEAQRSENGSLVTSDPVRINFDNTNKKLIISSNVRVKSPTFTMNSGETVEVPYPSIGTYKLVFNKETNEFLFVVIASSVAETRLNRIELATVVFSTTAVRSVYGIDNYTIDGLVVSVGGGSGESLNGMLVASEPENINFDFVNSKLKITADKVRLNIDKATTLLPAVELDFLSIANQLWQKMIYNKSTKAFSAKQFSTVLDDNEIVFAYVHPLTEQVYGVADFYRNSKPTRYTKKLLPVIATYGDLRPKYIQPTLPEFNTILNSYGSDYTKIYQLYDALMAAHPEYITKRLIGSDALNNPIYSYQFTTPEVPTASKGSTKPKFIIFSGVHGGEKGGTYNTYNAMKQICERHEEDDHLHALKQGVNFIVVPVAVPTGFIQGSRKNHNGVDIARNFPTGWLPVSNPESQTYSGTGPLSEKETQALVALMEEHKDALCFISHHNFTSTDQMVWVSARSNQMVNMSKMLILGETLKARKKYSWMPNDAYLGYTDLSGVPNGMEASHADALGMYGCTLEVGMITPWEPGGTTYSSVFATLSCQFLINYMLVAIDSAAKTTLASISNP